MILWRGNTENLILDWESILKSKILALNKNKFKKFKEICLIHCDLQLTNFKHYSSLSLKKAFNKETSLRKQTYL